MAIQIKELVTGLSATDFVDYINWNFDQILLNGGGPQGPIGTIGLTGPQGAVGSPGNVTYTSDLDVSTISNPSDGDLFIVGDSNNITSPIYYPFPTPYSINPILNPNGDIFIYDATNSVWVFTGTNIKGEQGQIGLTGDTVFDSTGNISLIYGLASLNNVNLFKIFLSDSNYSNPTNKLDAPVLILGPKEFTDGVNSYDLLSSETVTDSSLSHLFYSLGRPVGSPSFNDRGASNTVRFFTGPPKHPTISPNNSIVDSFYIQLNRTYGNSQNSRDLFETVLGVSDANPQNKIDVKVGVDTNTNTNTNVSFRKNFSQFDKPVEFLKSLKTYNNVIFDNSTSPFNFTFESDLISTFTNHITLSAVYRSLNFNSHDTTFNLDNSNIILDSTSIPSTANISLIGDNTNTANITITNNSGVDSSGNININKGFIKAFSDTTTGNSYHFLGLGSTLGTSEGLLVTNFFGSTLTNINTDLLLTSGNIASITNTTINLGTSSTSNVNIATDGTQIIKIGDSSTAGAADQTIEIATNDYTLSSSLFFWGPSSLQSNAININSAYLYITVPKGTAELAKPLKVVTTSDVGRVVASDIDLTTEVANILPITNGGTGVNTFTSGVVISTGGTTNLSTIRGSGVNFLTRWTGANNDLLNTSSIFDNTTFNGSSFIELDNCTCTNGTYFRKNISFDTRSLEIGNLGSLVPLTDAHCGDWASNVTSITNMNTLYYIPWNLFIDLTNHNNFNLIDIKFTNTVVLNTADLVTLQGFPSMGNGTTYGFRLSFIHVPNSYVGSLLKTTIKFCINGNQVNTLSSVHNPIFVLQSATNGAPPDSRVRSFKTGYTAIPIRFPQNYYYANAKDIGFENSQGVFGFELKLVQTQVYDTYSTYPFYFVVIGGSGMFSDT